MVIGQCIIKEFAKLGLEKMTSDCLILEVISRFLVGLCRVQVNSKEEDLLSKKLFDVEDT